MRKFPQQIAAWSDDGRYVAGISDNGQEVHIFDAANRFAATKMSFALSGAELIDRVAWSSDATLLSCAVTFDYIKIARLDLQAGQVLSSRFIITAFNNSRMSWVNGTHILVGLPPRWQAEEQAEEHVVQFWDLDKDASRPRFIVLDNLNLHGMSNFALNGFSLTPLCREKTSFRIAFGDSSGSLNVWTVMLESIRTSHEASRLIVPQSQRQRFNAHPPLNLACIRSTAWALDFTHVVCSHLDLMNTAPVVSVWDTSHHPFQDPLLFAEPTKVVYFPLSSHFQKSNYGHRMRISMVAHYTNTSTLAVLDRTLYRFDVGKGALIRQVISQFEITYLAPRTSTSGNIVSISNGDSRVRSYPFPIGGWTDRLHYLADAPFRNRIFLLMCVRHRLEGGRCVVKWTRSKTRQHLLRGSITLPVLGMELWLHMMAMVAATWLQPIRFPDDGITQ